MFTITNKLRTIVALGAVGAALALAASIAPAASADPQPLASAEAAIAANGRATTAVRPNPDEQTLPQATVDSGPCSEVCSGDGYGFGNSSSAGRATTAVRPNPDEQTPPQATVDSGPCSEVCSGDGYGFGNSSSAESGAQLPHNPLAGTGLLSEQANGLVAAAHTPAVVHVTAPSGGFDWGDAGVGAGGMLALILIGVGGVLTVARRRSHSVTPTTRPNPQAQH
jgi:hypothetical protein